MEGRPGEVEGMVGETARKSLIPALKAAEGHIESLLTRHENRIKRIKECAELQANHRAYEENFDKLLATLGKPEHKVYASIEHCLNRKDIAIRNKYCLSLGDRTPRSEILGRRRMAANQRKKWRMKHKSLKDLEKDLENEHKVVLKRMEKEPKLLYGT